MARKGVNEARLRTIYSRQGEPPPWGPDYVPCMLATPQEAPSSSRAFILTPAKLGGRETHLLSTAELSCGLLGLYHPNVCGLQEQRMLSPEPTVHPLWTMPGAQRTDLKALPGLIEVAERLDCLSILPRVYVAKGATERVDVVFPWLGDLLWALRRPNGDIYCVNWTIKDKRESFGRKGPSTVRNPSASKESAWARHEVEKVYYADADIRTERIGGEELDFHVAANLRELFLHHRRNLALTTGQREEILDKFRCALETETPPGEVIGHYAEKGRYSIDQSRSTLYQAIWHRELRVDLFHPVLVNRPLRRENRDVIEVYADWFKR